MKKIILFASLIYLSSFSFAQKPDFLAFNSSRDERLAPASTACVSPKFERYYLKVTNIQISLLGYSEADSLRDLKLIKECETNYFLAAQAASNMLEYSLLLSDFNLGWTQKSDSILQRKIYPEFKRILAGISIKFEAVNPDDSLASLEFPLRLAICCETAPTKLSFEELLLLVEIYQYFDLEGGNMALSVESQMRYDIYIERLKKLAAESACPFKRQLISNL